MINKHMMSSNSEDWETPQELYDDLNEKYHFTLDACASHTNHKHSVYFTKENDALAHDWFGMVFMNPPYGTVIKKWIAKAWTESMKGHCMVVCLLPARTDTAWFHDYCTKGKITFLRGRLKFSNSKASAPFPSMIVVFNKNPRPERFIEDKPFSFDDMK